MNTQTDNLAGQTVNQVQDCRVCGAEFLPEPLLSFANMPKAAQNFPDEASLSLDQGENLTVYQCSLCGLVQLSNPPVSYYRDVIRAAAFSPEMRDFRVQQFSQFVGEHQLLNRPVLEVGCGQGEFLGLIADTGAKAVGLEHLASSVESCRDNGLTVEQGYLENAETRISGAPFAAFMILNFFEHMPDPNSALQAIAANLEAQGVGVVEVPNFDMIIRQKLFSEFINDHLFYFTEETLTTSLNRNGFEVVNCESVWYDYILRATVKKRLPTDVSGLQQAQSRITAELHQFLKQHQTGKVAVWGAGHQALAVLALADIAGQVDCVIDSAPFKQNRFTPSTHLPILPPTALRDRGVDVVIVMAASYSDEVAGIVMRDYPEVRCAVLRDNGLEVVRG